MKQNEMQQSIWSCITQSIGRNEEERMEEINRSVCVLFAAEKSEGRILR